MRTLLALVLSLAASCAAPSVLQPRPERASAGASVEGRSIEFWTVGRGPRRALYLASIHGNEPAGTPLFQALLEELRARPERIADWTLTVVPALNPDGLAGGTRGNANGVDLNRNFPAENRAERARSGPAALSEPESRALARLVEATRPELVISVHQPLACIDWDGDGAELAARMAEACALPARKLGGRPGSLGSWLGEDRGVPVLTLELEAADSTRSPHELWERYGAALLAPLR